MLSKQQLLDSCAHEIRVIKHLVTKVPPSAWDWRPTPKQRSLRELAGYLPACASVPAKALILGNWEHAEADEAAAARVPLEKFAQAMDAQMETLRRLVEPIPDEDLLHRQGLTPWGTPCTWGEGLVNLALKTLVAYRMQLFLWAKESGNHSIGPSNCWVGVDRSVPASN